MAIIFCVKNVFYAPVDPSNNEQIVFEVKDGEGIAEVGKKLETNQLIKSDLGFSIYTKIRKISLKPGAYQLSKNQSIGQIASKMAKGDIAYTKVLFQEGLRREQMAQILSKKGFGGSDEFMSKTEGLEGKLFPDTYYFPMKADMSKVLSDITENYDKRTSGLNITKDNLIIASLIEREAANDDDRRMISSVFHNRAKISMKFESDVTVQYQKDTVESQKTDLLDYKFWQELKYGDVSKYAGPFNSYSTLKLAGAICNPGLKSIQAALNPETSDYLYFLYGNDGKLYLAKNSAQHQINIEKYLRN